MPSSTLPMPLLRAVASAFAAAFRDVNGVEMHDVHLSNTRDRVFVMGAGWSPSLHRLPIRWSVPMRDLVRRGRSRADRRERETIMAAVTGALDGDQASSDVLAALGLLGPTDEERALMTQRAGLAAGHGFASPLLLPEPSESGLVAATTLDAVVIHHVQIDRAVPDLLLGHIVEQSERLPSRLTLRRTLVRMLIDLHAETSTDPESLFVGETFSGNGGATTRGELNLALRHETPFLMPCLPLPSNGFFDGPRASFDGEHLFVPTATLPETTLAAAIGLAVGDLVSTRTPFDARVIAGAEVVDTSMILTVEPDLIPLDSLR